MKENSIQDLKAFAADTLVRSKDDLQQDKKIVEKIKDKVVIIKESNTVEVIYEDHRPLIRIPLYLIGKFIGHKILEMFDNPCSDVDELSKQLNLSPQALSRPLGILLGDIVEKTEKGYKVRAFKILDFLESLESDSINRKKNSHRQVRRTTKVNVIQKEKKADFQLNTEGVKELASFLNIPEEDLRKLIFFRENDFRIIDPKFIDSKNAREIQLDFSLAHLIALKHCFNEDKCPANFLRNKLILLGIKSLTNLTTNLHKYPQYIIHDAGKKGSKDNYFVITLPGENRIKEKIYRYVNGEKNEN